MLQYVVAFYLLAFVSSVLNISISQIRHGTLFVHMITMWLAIFGPTFTEENTLTFYEHIFKPNMMSLAISLTSLVVAGIAAGMFVEGGFQKNSVGQYIFTGVSIGCLTMYVVVVVIVMPVNVNQCNCLYGYYGAECEKSCFGSNNFICSGHGTCSVNGCICEDRFQGLTCNACINEYNYDTNCSACNQGYSLTFQCTKCTTGRDPTDNCQGCLEGYLDDLQYNSPELGCTVCKQNYFRPSTDPRIGSYNSFLQYGETCAPCLGDPVCNGHGTCNHFLLPNALGDFEYDGIQTLGLQANGQCVCEQGFFGETCLKGFGYDGSNLESICNGNGYVTTVYNRNIDNIFETFQGIKCVCDEGWSTSIGEGACSCKENSAGICTECAFGYFLKNGKCLACPGGSFTRACNLKNGGGICQEDGVCECRLSYASGGYTGASCSECANNNFFSEGLVCHPCPGAFGPNFGDSCGGHGVCITQKRLATWEENTDSSDSYGLYQFRVGAQAKSLEDLGVEIGRCECFEDYSLNSFGTCS